MKSLSSRVALVATLLMPVTGCGDEEPVVSPVAVVAITPPMLQSPTNPVVNTLTTPGTDGICDDNECTLDEALNVLWLGDFATITFAPGLTGTIRVVSATQNGFWLTHGAKIIGPGADKITIDASGFYAAFRVGGAPRQWTTYEISGLTIDGGGTASTGIRMSSTLVSDSVTVRDVVIRNFRPYSTATERGGAVSVRSGRLTLINSTITNNHAEAEASVIFAIGALPQSGVTIINSTLSGNSAVEGIVRGWVFSAPTLTIMNSTIANNTGTGLLGSALLSNTVLANNSAGNCLDYRPDVVPPRVDGGYNLDTDGTCNLASGTSLSGTVTNAIDAKLGPLANNGGVTTTHALLAGSPALNAGDPLFSNPSMPFDQRGTGFPRVASGRMDIGAFEYQALISFTFSGFYAPVLNPPAVNVVKAGGAVPIKFSLGGDKGLDVFAAGHPKSEGMACGASQSSQSVTATATAGSSALAFDPATQQYSYVWKTDKEWAGTCRVLALQFTDGTTKTALFRFDR